MKLTLVNKKDEVAGVVTFVFQPAEKLEWQAGQFLHYVLHHEPTDSRGSDRWFTVSSAPFENQVQITTRLADEKGSTFKAALKNLAVGETIEISDIDGDFVVEDQNQEYIFIAGGIGITPFHSILKQRAHDNLPIKVILMYANRDENIVFKDELEEIAVKNPNLKINYFIGPNRIDEEAIRTLASDLQKPIFYVSGPEPMVDALGKTLKEIGVPEQHLKQDWFPGYLA